MKTTIDLEPLNTYVTREVSPFYLIECLNGLSLDYMRLLIEEMEKGDPGEAICKQTYDRLFELHQVSACLIEGLRRTQEQGVERLPEKRNTGMSRAMEKAE